MSASITSVLMLAHKLIEKHGWVQRIYGSDEVGYCMLGAIQEASRQLDPEASQLCWGGGTKCAGCVMSEWCKGMGGAVHWNDTQGRTKEEVLEMLVNTAAQVGAL